MSTCAKRSALNVNIAVFTGIALQCSSMVVTYTFGLVPCLGEAN